MKALGRHILVEFSGCNAEVLNDVSVIERSMIEAAQIAGATVINSTFHHFSPWGVSGVVVIQESHLAIHTWPEYRYAAVDLFTCGDSVDPWVSFEHLKKAFQANYSAIEMNRGSLHVIKKTDFQPKQLRTEPSFDLKKGFQMERNVWFTDKDENQALSLRYTGDVLFDETNPFQRVRVLDSYSHGKFLAINNMVMCTERDEFHYHEMIAHPVLQAHGNAKNVLVIGGGDGGTIREIFKYDQIQNVTMVEIDEAVIRASKEHLPTIACEFNNPKLNLIIGDGIQFVKEAAPNTYDVIIVDGSDPVGPAQGLFTAEFYTNCKNALKDGGIIVTQGESPMFHEGTFVELNHCLKGIFGKGNVHTMLFHATTYPSGMWSLQVGVKGSFHPAKDFNKDKARQFSMDKGLKYYNEDVHSSAFALPTFVRTMLGDNA
ncbi:polyamine aminopropyltransferase [Bdellovibrio sp.]|uniref:polyamine aminopropyltransferase n=1 Tax=Bdellovibrio sp. TaxID=28201 RepID=UPI0039E257DF